MSAAADTSRAPERSRTQTRARLVTAATELFASHGLHRTTTVHIAHQAGVAVGTFYLHFRDKHELFREIVFAALDGVRARLTAVSARSRGAPRDVVRARAEELLDFGAENRNLIRVLFGRDHEAADLGEEVLDALVLEFEAGLRKRIATGQAATELNPAVAAQALAVMWPRVVAWWIEDPGRAPREEVVDTLVRLHPFASPPA